MPAAGRGAAHEREYAYVLVAIVAVVVLAYVFGGTRPDRSGHDRAGWRDERG